MHIDHRAMTIFSFLDFQASEQEYEKEKLNERIAKLSGGVAVIQVIFILRTSVCFLARYSMVTDCMSMIFWFLNSEQVGAQTETELKEKKLRVEDALNATKVCHIFSRVCIF